MDPRTTDGEHAGRTRGPSVRTRVIVAVLALIAFALGATSAVDFGLERSRLAERLDASLDRRLAEFRTLAETGLDPATGAPFATADGLVSTALVRTIPEPTMGELGIVGGRVAWSAPDEVPVRLEEDPAFTAHVVALAAGDGVVRGTLTTDVTRYEYLVIPVRLPDAAPGADALVFAYDLGAEIAELESRYRWRLLSGAVALLLSGALVWLLVGRLLEPIGWVRDTAREITETDLSRRIPVRGRDDLAELTGTVNGMLDRLEATFAGQRRLLDDVGHELRTPLTIVRGHLEVMDEHDPADAASTRALALDELDRMNRLVADLLLLAGSERPGFVAPERVHVGALLDDVLEKARPLGDRRWRLDDFPDAEADLDAQRVTQALLQLAANAVAHSEPGSAITLGARVDADRVRLHVRDEGEGIAPEQQERIFERFTRAGDRPADGSARAGLGLGLTIVRSIAEAHGGRVEVASSPGRGSEFTLDLPRRTGTAPGRAAGDATPTGPVPAPTDPPPEQP